MHDHVQYDAHERPPEPMRSLFKRWQKAQTGDIDTSNDVVSFLSNASDDRINEYTISTDQRKSMSDAANNFLPSTTTTDLGGIIPTRVCEIKTLPGLLVYPSLISPAVQIALLDRLLHRDLSNPVHKTNLHLHYHVAPPERGDHGLEKPFSFFELKKDMAFEPKDSTIHKPLKLDQVLQRKLRWMTLGGQYDWTAKVYPVEKAPAFPADVAQLLRGFFPDVDPQAAILNFYSPWDTLSVHRDVSEECDRGLISISIGCDAIFIVGNGDGSSQVTLRLRSGDALLMSREARFAWHAVPKIIANTCPKWLEKWPALPGNQDYDYWQDWMQTKRLNLNVRQMKSNPPCD